MIQSEANELFEGITFEYSEKFANINKTTMVFLFFLPILPFGSLAGFLALFSNYWSDFFNLITYAKSPPLSSAEIIYAMYEFFDFVLFGYAVSHFNPAWQFYL